MSALCYEQVFRSTRSTFWGRNALAEVICNYNYGEKESRLLFAAGESLENVGESKIPDCLKFKDLQLLLKQICREAIRKHLLDLDPHSNLFCRIPRLGLPQLLNQYLLYGESLDDGKEEEEDFGCDDDHDNDGKNGCDSDDDINDHSNIDEHDNSDDNENIFDTGSDDSA